MYKNSDVSLLEVTVKHRPTGTTLSLLNQVTTISIYEDMTKPTMMADISVNDKVDIIGKLPILGEEDLILSFNTPGLPPVEMTFAVYSIEGHYMDDQNKGHLYNLKCVSKEHLKDSAIEVQKSYKETSDKIVYKILTEDLQTSKKVFLDPSKGNSPLIVPSLKPFMAIDMLRRRSVHTSYESSSFVFFENQKGFYFKCVEQLIEDGKNNIGSKKFNFASDVASEITARDASYRTIINYLNLSRVDTVSKIRSGGLNNRVTSYDFFTKKITHKDTLFNEKYNKFVKMDVPHLPPATVNLLSEYGTTPATSFFVPTDTSRPSNFIDVALGSRILYTTLLNQNTVRVLIHGDSSIKIGDIIELTLPESSGMTGRKKDTRLTSGRYLIKNLRHMINVGKETQHQISMDCVKIGFIAL